MSELERVANSEVVPDEGWSHDDTGLPIFTAHTIEAVESAWSSLEGAEGTLRLSKGAVAAEVSAKRLYGGKDLENFCARMRVPYSTTLDHLQLYKRAQSLQKIARAIFCEALESGALQFSHARLAAPIDDDDEFMGVLAQAQDEGLTKAQTASLVKPILARQRAEQLQELEADNPVSEEQIQKYSTVVIDPPWEMQKIEREVRHLQQGFDYPTMNAEELMVFEPMKSLPADDCHLYLWTTHKHLPLALRLAEVWGFKYECLLTWVKNVGFTPYSWMRSTEHVLFCRRGSLGLHKLGVRLDFHGKVREHSRKPEVFYDIVREVSPGPRIDVFSREDREGFDAWGNEKGALSA